MGSLRHVATCICAARPFLQRLRVRESNLHLFQIISVTEDMKQGLLWWLLVLHDPQLNGVSLEYFNTLPPQTSGRFGFWPMRSGRFRAFCTNLPVSPAETALISDFNFGSSNGIDINFRELLSWAFAVNEWGQRWSLNASHGRRPIHVHFKIDNPSAVAWKNKLSLRNPRAQVIIRLLSWWETSFQLRSSASHVSEVNNSHAGSRLSANPPFETRFASLPSDWSQVSPKPDVQGLINISQLQTGAEQVGCMGFAERYFCLVKRDPFDTQVQRILYSTDFASATDREPRIISVVLHGI
ncbi:hypothetical protein PHMEG_00018307 [Phytophthora megakarya]|uniref:Uncharacterized protein n=1 Tax=Phytophthora megakarya TaxID=4795 RepID=A0A225VWW6_9STRA|nr:hypothetical protein PHMEG_00018307 [Phytophthora megakarya]